MSFLTSSMSTVLFPSVVPTSTCQSIEDIVSALYSLCYIVDMLVENVCEWRVSDLAALPICCIISTVQNHINHEGLSGWISRS